MLGSELTTELNQNAFAEEGCNYPLLRNLPEQRIPKYSRFYFTSSRRIGTSVGTEAVAQRAAAILIY